MKLQVLLLLVALSVFCVPTLSFSSYGEPCTVSPSGSLDHVVHKEIAKDTCMNGSIWWNYPRGSLQVTFKPQGHVRFNVCLKSGLGPLVESMFEVTAEGKRMLENPNEDKEVCLGAVHGQATVELTAPQMLVYMTLYEYRIVPQHNAK